MPEIKSIQFRPAYLADALAERSDDGEQAGASRAAQRDLGRYYSALALALASVELTSSEALLLVDILNGSHIDVTTAQMLHYEVEDAELGYFDKWEVDPAALIAKVRGWSLLQRLAVVDAVERAWGNSYRVENMAARVVRVGLVKVQA